MNKKLMKDIKKFYKHYNIANPDYAIKITMPDMYNYNTLMDVYECIWDNMPYYEGEDNAILAHLNNLYGELGYYLDNMPSPYKWQSQTMGNIVCTFGEVAHQVWDSLVHYHTIDIKWSYNKRGF